METSEATIIPQDLKEQSRQEALAQIEELKGKGILCVVPIPYSSNMQDHGPKKGQPRLSYFSSMSIITSAKLCSETNIPPDFILVGEHTFGKNAKSTTDLMTEKLHQINVAGGEGLSEDFDAPKLNNTAFQIDALSKHQHSEKDPQNRPYLLVGWEFHLPRLKRLAKAYGLNAEFISIETILNAYYPNYNETKYAEIFEEFKKRENSLPIKILGQGKGTALKLVTRFRGGSINDLQVARDKKGHVVKGKLTLLDTTGKKRMKEVNAKPTEV